MQDKPCEVVRAGNNTLDGKMEIIKSTVNKSKKNKFTITTYTFVVDNDVFVANYFSGTSSQQMEIIHNDTLLGRVNIHKAKSEYVVNQEAKSLKVTMWIDKGHFFQKKGVGIEVNGNPIQHTMADPEIHIKNGKYGLYFLLFIFSIKSIATYYYIFKEYASHIVAGINSAIYFLLFIIVLLGTVKYKTWTKFSIITGLVLVTSELVFDYLLSLLYGNASVNIWAILIRIYAIYVLYNAFRWKQKLSNLLSHS